MITEQKKKPVILIILQYYLPDDSNLKRFSLGVKRLISRNSKIVSTFVSEIVHDCCVNWKLALYN